MVGKEILNQLTAYKQGMQIADVKRKYNLDKIVKLASNENPYGCSSQVKEQLNKSMIDYEIYPDGYTSDLRMKLSEKLNVDESQIVFGNGSDEVITFICRAFLYPGVNTVMASPTFTQYRHHSLIEGAEVREVPTRNGKHDLEEMKNAIDKNTKVVWICTPDNPTGTIIQKNEFKQFMDEVPPEVLVVLDEAYYEFVAEQLRFSLHDSLFKYPNLIVLRTFSKIYGLAGLRVGYGIANSEIAHKLNVVRGPFNTTSFSQKAAIAALQDDKFIEETKNLNYKVKKDFQTFLDTIGWSYYESHTNFLLIHTPIDADKVSHYLLQHGFIVRSGNLLGYPNTIRVTIGNEEDMLALQPILKELQLKINDGVLK